MLAGVTLHQFLVTGILASLFIIAFKALAARVNVGGLKTIAGNL